MNNRNVFKNPTLTKVASLFLCFFILSSFIYYSVLANTDLSAGRFCLFMDERITFDGVKLILHPDGFVSFINALVNGDQRYGRSLWVSMTIFSVVPELIWGDSGQIISGRMLQVFLITSASLILSFGTLRNWYLKALMILVIFSIPFSDYYLTMPKPEPLQLLFVSLLIYFYYKNKLKFGWYWIFAGLAFGTKISTLPLVIVFGFFALYLHYIDNHGKKNLRSIDVSILSFFVGLGIAVPILLFSVLYIVFGYLIYMKLKVKFSLSLLSQGFLIASGSSVIYFLSKESLTRWIASTFQNTTHGADQASINYLSWIVYFFDKWLLIPEWIGLTLLLCVFLFVTFFTTICLSEKVVSPNKVASLSIMFSGIALNIGIIFGAHRLWGFYLYPGTILTIAGLLIMIDLSMRDEFKNDLFFINKFMRILGLFITSSIFCIATIVWVPHTINGLKSLENRTNSESYVQHYKDYQDIIEFLNNQYDITNSKLKVMFDPFFFPPESNVKYKIVEFWGPYNMWNESPDVIIFGKKHTLSLNTLYPKDSPEYNRYMLARQGYNLHVSVNELSCQVTPCFERKLKLTNGGEILVLKHLITETKGQ